MTFTTTTIFRPNVISVPLCSCGFVNIYSTFHALASISCFSFKLLIGWAMVLKWHKVVQGWLIKQLVKLLLKLSENWLSCCLGATTIKTRLFSLQRENCIETILLFYSCPLMFLTSFDHVCTWLVLVAICCLPFKH